MPTRAITLLPCLNCRHGERAVEEVIAIYLGAMHQEPPPRPHELAWRFLPKSCCRQNQKAEAEAMRARRDRDGLTEGGAAAPDGAERDVLPNVP